jgi:hypothetical protein
MKDIGYTGRDNEEKQPTSMTSTNRIYLALLSKRCDYSTSLLKSSFYRKERKRMKKGYDFKFYWIWRRYKDGQSIN